MFTPRVILLMTEFKLNEVDTLRQYALFKYIFTPSGIVVLTSYVRIVEKLKISQMWIVGK